MKSYFQKILFICMVNLTFTTMTFSQDIGSEWINVRGMGNQQIEKLMRDEIPALKIYTPIVLEKAMTSMNDENDARITEFNNTKITGSSMLGRVRSCMIIQGMLIMVPFTVLHGV